MAYENNLWQFIASLKLRPFKAGKLWHIGRKLARGYRLPHILPKRIFDKTYSTSSYIMFRLVKPKILT